MTLSDRSLTSASSLRFATLDELHTAHAELLRDREQHDLTAAVLDAATAFVERGVRSGALLYDTSDRRAAQSLLNYWSNILYRAGREPPDALLMLFDQSQAPLLDDALCPYIGLNPFDEQRKNLFFGRRDLVNELIEHLRDHRFLAVVGPSGSGKSSLVRAGLIPALRAGALPGSVTWRYIPPVVPGSHPLRQLAQLFRPRSADPADWERRRVADFLRDDSHLAMLIGKLPPAPTVLVIDQFEELFTLVDNKHEVRAFAANLARLAETPGLRHTVIVTLREEFALRIGEMPPLEGLFRDSRKQVTALLRSELREAIVQPAKQVGLIFDEWVVDQLVEDLAGDPAVLPLLQFTLQQLWINKDRNRITRAIYSQVGEGGKALEQAADAFYNRQPAQQNRDTIKLILLRMVEARQLGEITSRRIRRESLYTIRNDPGRIDRMLEALIEAGLVRLTRGTTPTDDQVELAHEALIRNWQKLRDWLDEQRARLRERQRLTSAADQWNAGGRDDGALWVSRELVKTTHDYSDLSPLEQAFVAASKAAIQAQEDAARRELEQVQALAEERAGTNRRLQRQRRWLIITALVAIITAGFAYWQYRLAEERREQLSAQALVLSMQSFRTDSDLFLRAAIWLAEHNQPSNLTRIGYSNPSDTLRLSLQNILQQAIQINLPAITHNGMTDADWSSDGQLIITSGADKVLRMWNIKTLEDTGFTPQQSYPISRTVLSTRLALGTRNPKQLLTADDNGSARILDTSTGATLHTFTHDGNAIHPVLNDAIWSPNERQVLTTGTERQVLTAGTENVSETMKLWDVDQNTLHCRLGKYNVNARVNAVAWSPDGHYIFTAIDDTSYHLWEIDGDQCREHMGFASSMRQTRTPSITAAVWSPDGQLLLTATNQLAEIWRIKKGAISAEPVARLVGHTEPIIRIAWSPDGKRILTAGEDKTIRFWDVDEQLSNNSNDPQRTISVKQRSELRGDWERIITAVWSPDSHAILVATSEKRGVTAADTEETVRVYYADDFDKVLRVARSQLTRSQKQKGDLLTHQELQILIETSQDAMPWLEQEAAATQTAEARVSQPTIGAEQTADTLMPQSETSSPLPMSPTVDITYTPSPTSSPTILAATATATATGVLAGTGVLTDTTALTPTITIIPVPLPTSADATLLPTPEPPTPTEVVVDTPIPTPTSTPPAVSPAPNAPPPSQLLGHTDFVLEARFSADGKLVASASKDGTARVWQASDGTQLLVLLHSARVNSVAFSPKENIILTSSDDQKGRIWDANNGRLIAELPHDGRVNNAEFSPDGEWVVTTSRDNTAKIWRASDGALTCALPHERQVFTALFSPDSTRLVTAVGDATARVWSVSDRGCSLLVTLQGHTDSVLSARFDRDGRRVITASTDGTARIWDVQTGQQLLVLRGHTGWVRRPSFSPDGSLALTAGDDGTARIWDANTGALVTVLQHGGAVNAARFSNHGDYISTASEDGIARLWDARNGQLIAELRGHNDPVISAEFSPNDHWLVTAGLDGSVRLWPVLATTTR